MGKPSICLVSSSRSDFDRICPVYHALASDEQLDVGMVLFHTHGHPDFAQNSTVNFDDITVWAKQSTYSGNDERGTVTSLAAATEFFNTVFAQRKPSLVIFLGDRYEMTALVSCCLLLNIPMAHVGGGQLTFGAVDESFRHMFSKAAHLHFVANEKFAKRLRQMGEEDWRIFTTGSPSIDYLLTTGELPQEELLSQLEIDDVLPIVLVAYHPETLVSDNKRREYLHVITQLLQGLDANIVLTYPNSDHGSEDIIQAWQGLAEKSNVVLHKNLGRTLFVNTLRQATLMLGNSSAGLIEAPTFGLPVINIGDRQQGRDCGDGVIHCDHDLKKLTDCVNSIINQSKPRSHQISGPYGDGNASARIAESIKTVLDTVENQQLLVKRFVDCECGQRSGA